MKESISNKNPSVMVVFRVLAFLSGITILLIIQLNNFRLFHYITESLSVIVGVLIFAVVWSGRDIIDNKPIVFLGIAYLFIAILDSFHVVSYKGMGILNLDGSNYTAQVWISARYIEAISILLVSIGLRKIYAKLTFHVYLALTTIILFTIFRWKIFPICYIEGTGLTIFKILSEYIIIGILFCAFIFFLYHRTKFHKKFVLMMTASIMVTIFSEFCFTLYTGVYDFVNGLGHILKVISYIFIYKAIFVKGIQNPQQFLFQRLSIKQKETMDQLRESENLYKTLLNSLPQSVFFVNRNSDYISCNISYAQSVYLEKSEIINKNVYDIHPKIVADRFRQEDLAIMDKGEMEELDDTIILGNQKIMVHSEKVPVRDVNGRIMGVLGIYWDITERKKIERELKEYRKNLEELVTERTLSLNNTNKQLNKEIVERKKVVSELKTAKVFAENLLETADVIVVILNHEAGITTFNKYAEKLTGYKKEEVIDKNWIDLFIPQRDKVGILKVFNDIFNTKPQVSQHENSILLKNDEKRMISWSNSVLRDSSGNISGFLSIGMDITERKQAEENYKKAKNEAEMANRAKSEFLANMSHDLRTPLNAILGNTQLFLRDTEMMDKYGSSIKMVHQSGLHLLSMINDILDLSKIEAGKMGSTLISIGFTDFLTEIAEVFKLRAEQKGLFFIFENNTDPSLYLKVDEKHLRQVLNNLLGNAVKFTEYGSVSLKIFCPKTSRKETGNKQEKKSITFEVRDTGIGIAKEKIESLFEPFFHTGRKKFDHAGTGLGLAICRKLIIIMGGDLLVRSTPGLGSAFWFNLELTVATDEQVLKQISKQQICGYMGRVRKILVADDIKSNRTFLKKLLFSLGFIVKEAADGEETLTAVAEFHPDLVLLDIHMPKMDGFETIKRIRQDPLFDNIIFVAMSANVKNKKDCIDAGFTGFLEKPVKYGKLYDLLCRNLNLKWTYKNEPEIQQETYPPLVTPPKEELLKLLELEKVGDIMGIEKLINKIEQDNDGYISFVKEIRQLTESYQLESFVEYINSLLDKETG